MATKIFVNLPVKDLKKTIDFFTELGFKFNPQFTDDNATCMIVNEDSYVMLLVEKFFKTFIHKQIIDANKSTEVILTLSADSREKVDEIIEKVIKAGGLSGETWDHGSMYSRTFQDPNGHLWEVMYMDANSMSQA